MTDLSREDVARLRELLEKATPGPWHCSDGPQGYQHRLWVDLTETTGATVCDIANTCDAALIVAMHEHLPALLALAEAVHAAPTAQIRFEEDAHDFPYLEGADLIDDQKIRGLSDRTVRLVRVQGVGGG